MSEHSASARSHVLLVVVAVVGGPSPFESPVDFVGVRVPPFAHAVLESGEQHDRDRVRGGRGDGADHDLRVDGDERGLRRNRTGDDLHRVCIGARHETDRSTLCARDHAYREVIRPIET